MYFPYSFWNSVDLNNQLLAFWTFNTCGNIGLDSLGNFNATVSVGSIQCVAGKIGNAAYTTDFSAIFDVPDTNKRLNLTSDKTFTIWIKGDDFNNGGGSYIFGKYFNSPSASFLLSASDKADFTAVSDVGGGATVSSDTVLSSGPWFFVVCKHNLSAKKISVQINNGIIYENTYLGNTVDNIQNFNLIEPTVGTAIDSFGIWNRLLTITEISYLYNNGNGREYPFI